MAHVRHETRGMHGFRDARAADHPIARLAEEQHGVVSGLQLKRLGLSQDAIEYRVRAGRLHRLHRGVFAVGHSHVSEEGRFLAGVLATGDGSVVGSISALALWGIRDRRRGEHVHITVARNVRAPAGMKVRRVSAIAVEDTSLRSGIPVLAAAPALLESATVLSRRELRRAVGEALVQRRVSVARLVELLAFNRGRPGVARLARVLADAQPTRSELEDATVAFLHAHGFSGFETNARVHGHEVDVLWRDLNLVVEADGGAFHDNLIARADDAAKQARLEALGLRIARVRWRDVTTGRQHTAEQLDRIMRRASRKPRISRVS